MATPDIDPSDRKLIEQAKQAKAKADAAKKKTTATNPATTKKATPAQKAIDNPTVANINSYIDSLKVKLEGLNVSAGLNPDGSAKTEPKLTRVELNAKNEEAGPPGEAPKGFVYKFIKSVDGGYWKLYSVSTGGSGGTGSGTGEDDSTTTSTPSTSVDVLKALLKAQGFSSTIVDKSATYLNSLLKDNLDYDNAIDVFLNTQEYTLKNGTKIKSPFYESYGYLNDGLTTPKSAAELFNAVEGYKGLKEKYGFSDKYLSTESLKGYVKNNVTVADLDERANTARLAAITADPNKTAAFIKLGFIANEAGLQDFYMDSKIGKEQLETNRNTGAFVAEAIRRNSTGIATGATQLADFKKIAADLTAKGYTEAQIATAAATGFQNIGQDLGATTMLAGIYEKAGGTVASNTALQESIQSELVGEEFMNMASSRRKRLEEQNKKSFSGESGMTSGSLSSSSTGLI